MAKAPYFPWMVRDWLCSRRVLGMSGDAVKAYVYLLNESWLQIPRATLPIDNVELASMARILLTDWDGIKDQVLQHFQEGKCSEHKGRFYNEKLLEISRKYENQQRPNNKNAKRSRIKRGLNAPLDNANAIDNDIGIEEKKKKYLIEENASYTSLRSDTEWIAEQQKYHPGLDILLSLEKAHVQFWGTEAGWEHTKRKRSKTKNWKRTYENSLSQKVNQVWMPRDQQQPDNIDKVCERMKKEGKL